MTIARSLQRGNKRLKPLIDFALKEGWEGARTAGGHLKFTKPGLPPIYTGSTPGDRRAGLNALALLRRTDRAIDPKATTREADADG
ncbi:type II toxin-antitoxin system HicA family toxin [Pseudomonas aeruginosa]|nr:type II toxin-antitoxin system HicA family toxin [Pseudomonas aeruginosa]